MIISVYTDGGCSGNKRDAGCPGAWAFIIVDIGGNTLACGDGKVLNTTNNRMEMTAVIKGLQEAKIHFDECHGGASINDCIVVSDSKYVVDNYDFISDWKEKGWRKSGGGALINVDLWKEIHEISPEFKSLKFKWVKGHSTNKLNQKADELVRAHLYPTIPKRGYYGR